MKKLYLVGAVLALFSSCTEIPLTIGGGSASADTTFTAGLETAQPHRVLIEESTGASCSNCPKGSAVIETLEAASPGLVIPIGLHAGSLSYPNTKAGTPQSKYDFRTKKGDELLSSYFSELPSQPAAVIGRLKSNGVYFQDRNDWPTLVGNQLKIASPVNVTVTSNYNTTTREAVIKVHVAYTADLAKKQNLTIMLLESNIVDVQEDGTVWDSAYNFQNVLRDIITPVSGKQILTSFATITAGRVYESTIVYTVDAAWKPENCKIVAFVHNNESNDIAVQQVATTNLK